MTDLLFDRFETLLNAPNGVKKMREMILQLAVLGKLVPQDPNDEPASVLLKKIKAEKQKLIAEGKLKKDKPLPPIKPDEIPYELPKGWEWCRLSQIGEVNPRNYIDDDFDVSFIPMTLISEQFGISPKFEIRKWSEIKNGFTHFKNDDVVLAKITPCFQNGKSAVMHDLKNGYGAGTTELHIFRGNPTLIAQKYVYIYFKTPTFLEDGINSMTGTAGQQRVPKDYVFEKSFPLPPINEQVRIISKVEQLMALCDELEKLKEKRDHKQLLMNKAALFALMNSQTPEEFAGNWQRIVDNFSELYHTPENVAELKKAILQLAVQGKLVPQDPNDEPASVLLKKIKAEKQKLIAEGKLKKEKSLPSIKTEEIPYELPKGWEWERLNGLFRFIDYRGKTPTKTSTGIKLITAKNVRMGFIDPNPKEYITKETYDQWMTRGYPKCGDLLFTTEAPLANIAQIVFNEPFALAQRVIDFQPWFTINSEHFKYSIMSQSIQNLIIDKSSGTTAKGIKASRLKNILVPVPPLNEQYRIVAKVDLLMALCNELETRLTKARDILGKVMESVVNGWFISCTG